MSLLDNTAWKKKVSAVGLEEVQLRLTVEFLNLCLASKRRPGREGRLTRWCWNSGTG